MSKDIQFLKIPDTFFIRFVFILFISKVFQEKQPSSIYDISVTESVSKEFKFR